MIRRIFIVAGICLLSAGFASAQRGGGGGGSRGGGGGGDMGGFGGGGRGPALDKMATLTQELKLTAQQQTALQAIFDDAQKQTQPLVQQATVEQNNVLKLEMAGQDSSAAVQKLAAAKAQVKLVEVDAFNKVMSKLEDNQKKKAEKLYQLMEGMFVGQSWRRS